MKEIVIYGLAALASLSILAYSIHMFIGGLVSPATERWAISAAVLIGGLIIAFLAWDVAKHRKK